MRTQLKAKPIEARTKGQVKQLRREGFIPVSVQHRGQETLHLQEEEKPLDEFIRLHGQSALIDLVIEPGRHHQTVQVHDVQRDPISQHLLQVTFQRVERGDEIKAHVPIRFHGEPEPVRYGKAIMQHPAESVEIRCKPQNLPDYITLNLSDMTISDVRRVSDLPHDDHYMILSPPDTTLATLSLISAPPVEEETAAIVEEQEITEEAN